jgi:hypothetical protein
VSRPDATEDALDLLLLRAWALFNRAEEAGILPDDRRAEAVEALRAAHEALDAAHGTPPSFPYARFADEQGRLRLVR